MRNRRTRGARHPARGQASVEFALSIVVVLTLLVGFFDLARGLAAQAAVSEMAWAAARYAASGACLSNPRDAPPPVAQGEVINTGPACPGASSQSQALTPSAEGSPGGSITPAQQEAIAARGRAAAFAIDASAATLAVQLPDQGTRLGQRVRVEVTYPYVPISAQFAGGRGVIQLRSSQTLLIVR